MDEADRCSRVGLLYAGRLVRCDTPRALRAGLEGEILEVHAADIPAAREALAGLAGVREVQTYGEALHLVVDSGEARLPEVEGALRTAGIDCQGVRIAPPRMEEAFLSFIRRMEES
jgi:ABC-2 type transport system ATP-binding protein